MLVKSNVKATNKESMIIRYTHVYGCIFNDLFYGYRWNATYLDYSSHVAPDVQDYGKLLLLLVIYSKHIYFRSIMKQVLATYINHSRVRFLEPTSTDVV